MPHSLKPWSALLLAGILSGCVAPARQPGRSVAILDRPAPVAAASVTSPAPPASKPEVLPPAVAPTPAPPAVPSPRELPISVVPAPTASHVGGDWVRWGDWSETHGLARPLRLPATNLMYALRTSDSTFVVTVGSHTARWNGLECWLGYAPRFAQGQPLLHPLDLAKTVWPLAVNRPPPVRTNGVIVLDPGHGGENPGALSASGGVAEKQLVLDLARRLQPRLERRGWRVFLTRTNDTDVALSNRVAFADRCQADLFISLHLNSAPGRSVQSGIETYCQTPSGLPSSLTRQYADEVDQLFPNNAFDDENLRWAARLHRGLLQATGFEDRGIRRARFMAVLRGQQRPAVLLECGYLSSPVESRQLGQAPFREKVAEALAAAIGPAVQPAMAESGAAHPASASAAAAPPPM